MTNNESSIIEGNASTLQPESCRVEKKAIMGYFGARRHDAAFLPRDVSHGGQLVLNWSPLGKAASCRRTPKVVLIPHWSAKWLASVI
jgi:hypothetical protein